MQGVGNLIFRNLPQSVITLTLPIVLTHWQ